MIGKLDLRKPLDLAVVYSTFQRTVCGDAHARIARDYLRARPGDRVLDIGCGPGTTLPFLPDVTYVGFDLSDKYIKAARRKYGSRGTFYCQRVSGSNVAGLGRFDLVIAQGVVHHLDDHEAQQLFQLARSVLRPGGRLVTIDPCFGPGQSALSRWLVSCDRGNHVRPHEAYGAIARRTFGEVRQHLTHRLLRIPYSHIVLECRLAPQTASTVPRPHPSRMADVDPVGHG